MYVDTKEASAFRVVPDKPSLKYLADYLRHPERWPRGFEWDFNHCTTCALQLAHELWPEQIKSPEPAWIADTCDIPMEVSLDIFTKQFMGVFSRDHVRPVTVARRIERYLRWGFV